MYMYVYVCICMHACMYEIYSPSTKSITIGSKSLIHNNVEAPI